MSVSPMSVSAMLKFDQLDTNHDGVLSKEEFAALQSQQALGGYPVGPQNPGMRGPGSPVQAACGPIARQLVAGPPLRVASPPGAYSAQCQPHMAVLGAAGGPCYQPQPVSGNLSPLPGQLSPMSQSLSPAHEKMRAGRTSSPLPSLTGNSQNVRSMTSLALSLDAVSPSHEPERTFPRINDESPEASFEHKIEVLDKKENELQVLQMKMIAEQAQTFNRDVAFLKQFMQDLKANQEGLQSDMSAVRDSLGLAHSKNDDHGRQLEGLKGPHGTADERIKYLETVVGDSLNKHDKLLKGLRDSHDGQQKDLNDVKALTMHHASFDQRVGYLEKTFGDSFDKHARDLASLQAAHQKHLKETDDIKAHTIHHASFEQRLDFMEKCIGDNADRHSKDLKGLKDSHDRHVQDMSAVHHSSLPERMAYCEKLLGDSADKHAKELAQLKAAHDKHAGDVAVLKAASGHHANVQERVDYLERIMGDSADKHTSELQALKDAHSKHALELSGVKAAHGNQVRMEDRVGYLEKLIGDSASKHVQELEAMKAHYNGYFARFDKTAGTHSSLHASMKERVDQLEQRCGLTADTHGGELCNLKDGFARYVGTTNQHGQDLENLKLGHQQLSAQTRDGMRRTSDLEGSHGQHKLSLESAMAHLANGMPVHDRLKQLEIIFGDSFDKHGKELGALKDAHGQHSRILEGVNLSTTERLDAIERVLAFATDEKIKQTDEALKTTFNMYEQMRGRNK